MKLYNSLFLIRIKYSFNLLFISSVVIWCPSIVIMLLLRFTDESHRTSLPHNTRNEQRNVLFIALKKEMCFLFKFFFEDPSPFCVATDTPV